jgi:cytochrome c peroxidase
MTRTKIELGHRLFYDADLSIDGTMSCATCHEQKHAFADGNRTHQGVRGDPGLRNVPGLANVAWLERLTWADPRLTSLERQAAVPIHGDDPVEMGMKGHEAEISKRLSHNDCYVRMFKMAFPKEGGSINLVTVSKALAAFERTLLSFESPYDRYRRTGRTISEIAKRGEHVFRRDCANCHSGVNFTDGAYHLLQSSASDTSDRGLARVTGLAADDGRFRTPSLRNVALTGPYLHDGSAPTIDEAISRHAISLTANDRKAVVAFLDQLTDRSFTTDPSFALPPTSCASDT